jgi:hypothetical protein
LPGEELYPLDRRRIRGGPVTTSVKSSGGATFGEWNRAGEGRPVSRSSPRGSFAPIATG